MSAAKVISLEVRPSQASHLCFEVGGLLGEIRTHLGAPVQAFDFTAFYATLGSIPTIPGHPARISYNFLEIQKFVDSYTVGALRAEPAKAALNKAINARANGYYAKFANAPAIIARMNQDYSPSSPTSKPVWLAALRSTSQQKMEQLRDAYLNDGRTMVVKSTNSVVDSTSETRPPPKSKPIYLYTDQGMVMEGGDAPSAKSKDPTIVGHQDIYSTDFEYKLPFLENFAQYHRAQISLIDEEFAQYMSGQNLPYLAAVFQNELNSIDSDVFRLQVAYLNTILMSPIAGTVTGIYKNPGEAVNAGEPVIRVENNAEIFLVSTVICRGPISIGLSFRVVTTLYDSPTSPTVITGSVVAVRGQKQDDQWEVIAKCNNLDSAGKPIFPLGYHFDYDNTTVSIK